MKGKFTVTTKELFQMTTYDNYIARRDTILLHKTDMSRRLYLNTIAYNNDYPIVHEILVISQRTQLRLSSNEFLISKSTFVRLILILMVKERLGHHNNMGSCFLTSELLNYIKNQS